MWWFSKLRRPPEFHFQKPPITCGVTRLRGYLLPWVYFYPPCVPPHSLAASGDGVSLASSLTKDKWALGLRWSTMAARGFQNSKLFFIRSKVMRSAMQRALTFTISSYVGICFGRDFRSFAVFTFNFVFQSGGHWRLAIKRQVRQPSPAASLPDTLTQKRQDSLAEKKMEKWHTGWNYSASRWSRRQNDSFPQVSAFTWRLLLLRASRNVE